MDYLLDTNILVHRIRESLSGQAIEQRFQLFSGNHNLIISAVTKGEILSFAKQSDWGLSKMGKLTTLLDDLTCFPVDGASPLMDAYAALILTVRANIGYILCQMVSPPGTWAKMTSGFQPLLS